MSANVKAYDKQLDAIRDFYGDDFNFLSLSAQLESLRTFLIEKKAHLKQSLSQNVWPNYDPCLLHNEHISQRCVHLLALCYLCQLQMPLANAVSLQ